MCSIRPRCHAATCREFYPLLEITAPGDGIPLAQNWSARPCTLPEPFQRHMDAIYALEVRADDIFVVTFPKCGTTWMQEAAWLITNDLNFERAAQANIMQRSVYLELSGVNEPVLAVSSVELAKHLASPRLLKTHLPAHLMPRQAWLQRSKMIYVARNPKDALVSYFHFYRSLGHYAGTLDEYVEDFVGDNISYAPFWAHVLDFWRMRHEPNVLFVTYEDMQRALAPVLERVSAFLEKPPLTPEQKAQLLRHLSFDSMKANPSTNPTPAMEANHSLRMKFDFMRRGKVGSYKDELSPGNQRKVDEWTARCLAGQGVTERDIFGDI